MWHPPSMLASFWTSLDISQGSRCQAVAQVLVSMNLSVKSVQDAGRGRLIPKYPWENMRLCGINHSWWLGGISKDGTHCNTLSKDGARCWMDGLGKWPNLLGISKYWIFQFIIALKQIYALPVRPFACQSASAFIRWCQMIAFAQNHVNTVWRSHHLEDLREVPAVYRFQCKGSVRQILWIHRSKLHDSLAAVWICFFNIIGVDRVPLEAWAKEWHLIFVLSATCTDCKAQHKLLWLLFRYIVAKNSWRLNGEN